MKRRKPSADVGGGEMKRATSSVVSSSQSDSASLSRSWRRVTAPAVSTGSCCRQSVEVDSCAAGNSTAGRVACSDSENGIFSIRRALQASG